MRSWVALFKQHKRLANWEIKIQTNINKAKETKGKDMKNSASNFTFHDYVLEKKTNSQVIKYCFVDSTSFSSFRVVGIKIIFLVSYINFKLTLAITECF